MHQSIVPVPIQGPKDKAHVDMSESARNPRSTCFNPCRGPHPCDENEAGQGPNCFRSLTSSYDCDDPTDEDWRAAVKIFAELKIEIREAVPGATESAPGKNIFQPAHRIKQATK